MVARMPARMASGRYGHASITVARSAGRIGLVGGAGRSDHRQYPDPVGLRQPVLVLIGQAFRNIFGTRAPKLLTGCYALQYTSCAFSVVNADVKVVAHPQVTASPAAYCRNSFCHNILRRQRFGLNGVQEVAGSNPVAPTSYKFFRALELGHLPASGSAAWKLANPP